MDFPAEEIQDSRVKAEMEKPKSLEQSETQTEKAMRGRAALPFAEEKGKRANGGHQCPQSGTGHTKIKLGLASPQFGFRVVNIGRRAGQGEVHHLQQ